MIIMLTRELKERQSYHENSLSSSTMDSASDLCERTCTCPLTSEFVAQCVPIAIAPEVKERRLRLRKWRVASENKSRGEIHIESGSRQSANPGQETLMPQMRHTVQIIEQLLQHSRDLFLGQKVCTRQIQTPECQGYSHCSTKMKQGSVDKRRPHQKRVVWD